MRLLTRRTLAAAVALAVLAGGVAYTLMRPVRWTSHASVVLVTPTAKDSAAATDTFDSAGVAGTFVELFSSRDTLRAAGGPPVSVAVRAIPDSRVITVATTGAPGVVQPALAALLKTGSRLAPSIDATWAVRVLQQPTLPVKAGPATPAFLVAAALLALLAGVGASAAASRILPERPREPAWSYDDDDPGDEEEDGAGRDAPAVPAAVPEALGSHG